MTVREALVEARRAFERASFRSPGADAEVVVGLALGCTRTELLARGHDPLPSACIARFEELLRRRLRHEPAAYLRGHQEFYGRLFAVTPTVLIPRPETELLVDVALARLRAAGGGGRRLLDVGTGSGCIALTMLAEMPELEALAGDISEAALEVAARNAEALGCSDRIRFICSDLFGSLPRERFDLIVSNPPYVGLEERDRVDASVQRWEPSEAVFAGSHGLAVLERLLADAPPYLKEGGRLILELGQGQLADLSARARDAGWKVTEVHPDLAGIERCAVLMRRPGDPTIVTS